MRRVLSLASLASLLALLTFASGAQAFKVISTPGEGAGQTDRPDGLAVNYETGRLYVADTGNNRVDVFGPTGAFEKSVGWGVANGQPEFQDCGPTATPSTAGCKKGVPGTGGGQFSSGSPTTIAVDNSCFLHEPEPLTGAECETFAPANGDVYVIDLANNRVQRFDEDGNFILTFGGGVNQTTGGDVCTAASGNACGAGADEFAEGAFSSSTRMFAGVGPGGVVYVLDNFREGESNRKYRLQRFEPNGALISPQQILKPAESIANSFAVQPNGDFYVVGSGGAGIREYEVGNDEPIGEIDEVSGVLATDSADNLFAGRAFPEGIPGTQSKRSIVQFDPEGNQVRRFGYGLVEQPPAGLAPYASANGDIYVSEATFSGKGSRVLHIDFPPPGPVLYPKPCETSFLGNTKATLRAEINPEGKATSFHFEYVDEKSFEDEGGWSSPEVKSTPESDLIDSESEAVATDFVLHVASGEAGNPTPLVPETEYRCRVVAANADDAEVLGEDGAFTTLDPLEIGASWASGIGTETATLNATVNPLGIPTTAYFQYVDEATYLADTKQAEEEAKSPAEVAEAGFLHATKAPAGEPINLGAGESFKIASTSVSGLEPGGSYRYRVLATDVLIAPEGKEVKGPTRALRTYRAGASVLPDGRRYELVSPAQKNNAEVVVGDATAGTGAITNEAYSPIQAGAGSGEAVTYTSWTAFADPESAPSTSQYLSRRAASGWVTESLSPFGSAAPGAFKPPFRGFDDELSFGALEMGSPPYAGCPAARASLYLRESQSGALICLTPEAPDLSAHEGDLCLDYAGASSDGTRAFFAANASYPGTGAPEEAGVSLYEWSAAEGLRLVSVLPNGKAAIPNPIPNFDSGFGVKGARCSTAEKVARNVVSADGRRAFWTYAPLPSKKEEGEGKTPATQLLARVNGEETIQLDKKVSGLGASGDGIFLAASVDGSKVFFSDQSNLMTGAGKGDLYLYDFGDEETPLADLTPESLTPGSEDAGVKGMVGIGDDGSHAYFVAGGVLTGAEENEAGQRAEAGANNLYHWHEGQIGFVAVLGTELVDANVWASHPEDQHARVSPDGRHLAFLSTAAEELAGFDNTIADGEHCQLSSIEGQPLVGSPLCAQAFIYDADSEELICASCNPSGSRPTGPSKLPGWSNAFEGPRYLPDDGSRLFFESFDALLPQDENELRDVYEFELEGKGSCTSQSQSFDLLTGGCHYLISTGKSEDESFLLDASSSGRDVFFSTREALTGWDTNPNYDVYDAREGGGFAEPVDKPICEGEGCKAPVPAPPAAQSSPGTATFEGPGNESKRGPARCRKGKVRRRGRCVKPRKASRRKADRRKASDNRRAAR
jgi:NHL repeat-containing protein